MDTKYPEFSIPQDYIVPEGVAEGESFEALATLKVKKGGKLCLVKVDGAPIYTDKKDAEVAEEPDDYGTESGMNERVTEAFKNRV